MPQGAPSVRASRLHRLVALLFGLGSKLNVRIIGYMPLSEIASLIVVPFVLPRITKPAVVRLTGWVLPLAMLWLLNAMLTDLYMQTQWSLAARGLARIVIYLVCIPLFIVFLQRDAYAKTVLFTLGQVLSSIISAYAMRSGVQEGRALTYGGDGDMGFETHWSLVFGLGTQLAILLVYPRSRLLAYGIGIAMGAFQLIGGSRSTAGIYIVGVAVCMARDVVEARGGLRRREKKLLKWIAVATSVMILGSVGYRAYQNAAGSGQLGEKAYQKYHSQSRSAYGIVFGGRPQILGGWLAAAESPIIGYGSWPTDNGMFFARACEILEVNLDPSYYTMGPQLIPSHSHVLCAWVENGVMGLVFWSYVFFIVTRSAVARYHDEKQFGLFLVVSCVSLMWHIVFSPIAGRLDESFLLALLMNQTAAVPRTRTAVVRT
ncbi:MAG: hypothetical protein SH850_19615 [Planctomycetaceae bacterium]|nr:hypothetical protein [Planctomycetaceae bacterium]